MDRICVYAKDNDRVLEVMKNHAEEIKAEVLAEELIFGETDGYVKNWSINKEEVVMGVVIKQK